MALDKTMYIKPARKFVGRSVPLLEVQEGASQTFKRGYLVVLSSGYAVVATASTAASAIGIATRDGLNTSAGTDLLVIPCKPGVFVGHVKHASSASYQKTKRAKVGTRFSMAISTSYTVWYLTKPSSTAADNCVTAIGLKDATSTASGAYYFMFNNIQVGPTDTATLW
jgi:hypothetical protein